MSRSQSCRGCTQVSSLLFCTALKAVHATRGILNAPQQGRADLVAHFKPRSFNRIEAPAAPAFRQAVFIRALCQGKQGRVIPDQVIRPDWLKADVLTVVIRGARQIRLRNHIRSVGIRCGRQQR